MIDSLPQCVQWTVPAEPQRVGQLRRLGTAHLKLWQLPDLVETVRLLISEIATNAVEHGGARLELELSYDGDEVRIEVADGTSARPVVKQPDAQRESGRGMLIVQTLAKWSAP